jgi:membrane protein DedA with SNARE-associated domain
MLAAVVENFFPPAPADVIITLAAFLSGRGTINAMTVFWVTWIANVSGAALVYLLARRLGPAFFKSGAGRRLMSPEAVVAVERNYVRWGLAGLIVARLLPGFRSFTAPFAGLMGLGWVRTLVPIAAASGAWYGTLILVGARLGRSLDVGREAGARPQSHDGRHRHHRRHRDRRVAHPEEQEEEQRGPSGQDLGGAGGLSCDRGEGARGSSGRRGRGAAARDRYDPSHTLAEEIEALTAHFRTRWHLAEPGASLSPEAARDIVEALAADRTSRRAAPDARADLR